MLLLLLDGCSIHPPTHSPLVVCASVPSSALSSLSLSLCRHCSLAARRIGQIFQNEGTEAERAGHNTIAQHRDRERVVEGVGWEVGVVVRSLWSINEGQVRDCRCVT